MTGEKVPIRYVVPPEVPAVFVTHFWVHSLGIEEDCYQLSFFRVELPMPQPDDPPQEEVEARCVARVVLPGSTARRLLAVLEGYVGQ